MNWYRTTVLVLGLTVGCSEPLEPGASEGDLDGGPRGDAARDGGAGLAAKRDGGGAMDAGRDGGRLDAALDDGGPQSAPDGGGGLDGGLNGGDVCGAESARIETFVAANRACASDGDCAIVGACSLGFGFLAVNVAARAEGQHLSDTYESQCSASDGPTFHAVCQAGSCVRRHTGHACGAVGPGPCPPTHELYHLACPGDAGTEVVATCQQRCTGPTDTRCGAGLSCQSTKVQPDSELYKTVCKPPVDALLCLPPRVR